MNENRTMEETLDLGWKLLGRLPREELDRVDTKILDNIINRLKKNKLGCRETDPFRVK